MATKTTDPSKYFRFIGDIALGKKSQDYNFEASIYHDQIQSRDNLINMYKEGLISKEMNSDDKDKYLTIVKETINRTSEDMFNTQIGVDEKEKDNLIHTAILFGAGLLFVIFENWLISRKG